MAAMVGARRALLAARYSPRGAIGASAAPVPPYRLADSPPRFPAEKSCAQSWIPHRAAGNLASERTDEDYHREWGQNNAGSYVNSRSNHFDHQLKRDAHSAGSTSGVNIGGSSEQPHRSGASYGFPNSNQTHTGARANNEQPGYNATQPYYRTSNAYSQQSLGGHLPNAHQQCNGAEAKSTPSGYGKGQTYHHPNGYGTYDSGYNTQSHRKTYKGERAIAAQYGYGPSGQGPNSVGNGQQVFQQQQYVDHRSRGSYPDRPGNPTSQYANPTHFRKEHVTGFRQGSSSNYGYNAPKANQSPYVTSQTDSRSTQGYSMYLNTDVQRFPNGIHQEKHSHVQPTTSFGNHLNGGPHQGGVYYQPLPGNPSTDGSPSEVSNEVSSKHKVTVEELEKLCENGNVKEATEILALLQENGTVLHAHQYFRLMQACGDATALEEARVIHSQISESSITMDTDTQNKILEMYAKCGSMEDAKKFFSTMDHHNLASWNAMISGFVHNGHGEEATDFFDQFKQTGDKPDPVMFKHIFLACGIMGSVEEGMLHFEAMQKDFDIIPTMEHYASIVSMLGQSGYIAEAHEFVERMPVEPGIEVWENLMNLCRLNGFLELGDRCAQIIERLDSSRLNEQSKMGLFPVDASDLAKEKERKKASVAEARSKVHEYRAGDRSHPDTHKIYEELRYLSAHMKEAGYIADTRFVLHDVDQETKEEALLAHSERLAISYGLITSAARSPIRVIKNLRSCGDCHTAFKIISKLVGRQIIARDAKRFHHFENGVCSCKDYW
ncbi:pentatricopeptide repeat-containing protein At4g32450, mitochondrial-like [Panicum virgatum]|uniref:DYW domain-containing protein n=1 Tax=Panicum virgatum TaxID=38727 RepID=A0A8T0SQX7_PANVG|nr:pentatricopeptide repeat-containing protein At4g32450, mitochondrial-like [Panicum virgatum]XP_039848960.1 pentatricopeptide repeat-containing protein At4g32450, mitochondrial-like [Panicum virgatum]KAG2600526.1 hypothetical protein PVAP13_5KG524900 [Panicum virgatum]KAG2600527.1 hypothetical protein PVAP13_5KG524900 [Panicum virgatum]